MPVKKDESKKKTKTEAKAGNKSEKKNIRTVKDIKANRHKKKTNMLRLYSEMNKFVADAVDREILKRFKIIIESADDDITKSSVDAVIKHTDEIEVRQYHESLHPYIKHYVFMKKRDAANKKKISG